ncbi:uncharacterized protein [Musca autumnalis]|uniref:uncharacterized protein n=1 Tax=Musca autumnalis TaxID=221902 RepID=UPI003CFB83F7
MFTNWLTGTTGSNSSSSTTNRLQEPPVQMPPNGLSLANVINSGLNPNMITTPPDVILEVGPGPTTMRFMAHSIMLGMHSGYLRSAIRLDERGATHNGDFIVYLSNVTPEQFAPLLSYMYTGYLDLNVENIFGVLLATHVLHMPRALEICRSYLARAQAEGYFGNSSSNTAPLSNSLNNTATSLTCQSAPKIIRPIASKPQLANFGFLPLGHPPIAASSVTPPSLGCRSSTVTATCSGNSTAAAITSLGKVYEMETNKDDDDDIEVDELDRQSLKSHERVTYGGQATLANNTVVDDDEEDVEVFIDTTSEDADVVVENDTQTKLSFKHQKANSGKESGHHSNTHGNTRKHDRAHKKSHRSDKRRKSGNNNNTLSSSSGLQVAKAPIPASQLDTSEANKVIIDVASCDGPVRFKRILNTAYGHKPETCSISAAGNHHHMNATPGQERSLQSVSLSFHQQMAKTISQQQHLNNAEESENSETSNGSIGAGGGSGGTAPKLGRKIQNEIFVCVYCKHTFKSQYCYQKHAKRHLNPLTLQATCVPPPEKKSIMDESGSASSSSSVVNSHEQHSTNLQKIRPFVLRNSSANGPSSSSSSSSTAEFLRREVRPLDMNVQYYPCKTCGCKFPSYYFVHKHRKMCHAEEEAAAQQNTTNSSTSGATTMEAAIKTSSPNDDNNMEEDEGRQAEK